MRFQSESLKIADAVMAGSGLENVAEGEGRERGVAAGAAAFNNQTLTINEVLADQGLSPVHAVIDVDHSPLTEKALAVGAPVAGTATVVDVQNGETARSPVLCLQVERT